MNPKSHKIFKEGIAEEVGVHKQVVDDFVSFYYSKVRSSLSNLIYPRIYIDNLGTFHLRNKKLENKIKVYKSKLGNLTKRTYNGYTKSELIQENINIMTSAYEKLLEDKDNKRKFIEKKYGKQNK